MVIEEAMKTAIINSRNSLSMYDIEIAIDKFFRREKVKNNEMGDK